MTFTSQFDVSCPLIGLHTDLRINSLWFEVSLGLGYGK